MFHLGFNKTDIERALQQLKDEDLFPQPPPFESFQEDEDAGNEALHDSDKRKKMFVRQSCHERLENINLQNITTEEQLMFDPMKKGENSNKNLIKTRGVHRTRKIVERSKSLPVLSIDFVKREKHLQKRKKPSRSRVGLWKAHQG